MAATATAPRTRRRAAPSKKPAKTARSRTRSRSTQAATRRARRRGITPSAGFAIPVAAVGRTATAVGGLADSGVVVGLTRGRLWIGLLGLLLVGIVGLNVYALSLSAGGSRAAQQAERLSRENSALRAQLTERLSNERIEKAAGRLGLSAPAPDAIRYLKAGPSDAKAAAKRLRAGELTVAPSSVAPAAAPATDPALAPTEPLAAPVAPEPVAAPEAAPAEASAPVAP